MAFKFKRSKIKPLSEEHVGNVWYIRESIGYDDKTSEYTYGEAKLTEAEYRIYNMERINTEALEAITELYELITGGE